MTADLSDVRGDPMDIDAKWMTAGLEAAGVARGAKVTGLDFRGFIGTGQTGRNARFSLTWDEPGRPASVVGKFSSGDQAASESAFTNGTYFNEHNFYANVAHTVDVRTPKCWIARYDEAKPDFVLIMEDLSGSEQGDQFRGLTTDEAELALIQAVALHAPRWGDPSVLSLVPAPLSLEENVARIEMFYRFTLDGFVERLGPRLDSDVLDLAKRFADKTGSWIRGTGTPETIVHFDFRPDNFLFGRAAGAPPLVVVDWQTVKNGLAMSDVAYAIGGSFQPAERADHERDLVENYRQRLVASGVSYDADSCWRDYRFCSLWGMIITVIATVLAAQTERGDDMLTTMAMRHGRHAIDLDALSLVT